MTREEYFEDVSRINSSKIKNFVEYYIRGTGHLYQEKTTPSTEALRFGSLLHECLEQPILVEALQAVELPLSSSKADVVRGKYTIESYVNAFDNLATKAYKMGDKSLLPKIEKAIDKIKEEVIEIDNQINKIRESGRYPITNLEFSKPIETINNIKLLYNHLWQDEKLKELFNKAIFVNREVIELVTCPKTDKLIKIMIDVVLINRDEHILIDYKSFRSENLPSFIRQWNNIYQAALYAYTYHLKYKVSYDKINFYFFGVHKKYKSVERYKVTGSILESIIHSSFYYLNNLSRSSTDIIVLKASDKTEQDRYPSLIELLTNIK